MVQFVHFVVHFVVILESTWQSLDLIHKELIVKLWYKLFIDHNTGNSALICLALVALLSVTIFFSQRTS